MLTNIRGLVDRLDISPAKGMMPLFEAISNSIDAIEERKIKTWEGKIRIKLIEADGFLKATDDGIFLINGFDISDNGIGFDDEHLNCFKEAYTLAKAKLGGRGVGRFTFLKVFSSVEIESVYLQGDKKLLRIFDFSIDGEVSGAENSTPTENECGSRIQMKGIRGSYGAAWPKDPKTIAEKIIEHFLIRFAGKTCPPITLEAIGHPVIDLHQMFAETVNPHIKEQSFSVGEQVFSIQAFKHRDGRSRHDYQLCANGREVVDGKLRDILPELPERLLDNSDKPYTLTVLVTGEYLDGHANRERTNISFQTPDELDLDKSLVSRREFNKSIGETLRQTLAADLKATHEEKIQHIARFVEKAPEYRVLTQEKYRKTLEQQIPPGLSEEKLDEALLHIRREIEDGLRKEEKNIVALIDKESFESYKTRITTLMSDMNDVGKAKLADYVAHRRAILDLIGQNLNRSQKDDKYPFEQVLHKMIFPMGVSSKEIFLEQQNLWLIDERLCFHTLLTSDKKLNSISGLENTSGKEPDIFSFFYDTPIGVSEPDDPSGGIVIIEFKRPGRDDYNKDPADQIIQRFVEISQGNVKDIDGRMINPKNIRYLGYLIADLTPTLKRQVAMRYHSAADGEGYFYTLPDGNGYIEIISYDKLVRDAKRRNRMLFEQLGIHKN